MNIFRNERLDVTVKSFTHASGVSTQFSSSLDAAFI